MLSARERPSKSRHTFRNTGSVTRCASPCRTSYDHSDLTDQRTNIDHKIEVHCHISDTSDSSFDKLTINPGYSHDRVDYDPFARLEDLDVHLLLVLLRN